MADNTMKSNISKMIYLLWRHVNKRSQTNFILLIGLAFFSCLAEMFSIGAVLPVLVFVSNPQGISDNYLLQLISDFIQSENQHEIFIGIIVIFIFAAFLAGLMKLLLVRFSTLLIFEVGKEISSKIFYNHIRQPMEIHMNKNSSELVSLTTQKVSLLIHSTLGPLINIITASMLLFSVTIILCIINLKVSLFTAFTFIFIYLIISLLIKEKIKKNGELLAIKSPKSVQAVQEATSGIKEILLNNCQNHFFREFTKNNNPSLNVQASTLFLIQAPKFILESIAISSLAIFGIYFFVNGEISNMLPFIGVLALSAQKCLPLFQQIFNSWSMLVNSKAILGEILDGLQVKKFDTYDIKESVSLEFNTSIEFKDFYFSYDKDKKIIFDKANLSISKGDRIGLTGVSGGGKSTFINCLAGLLKYQGDSIFVDGHLLNKNSMLSWRNKISIVPQSVVILNRSIEENIAFGIDPNEIDKDLLFKAINDADLLDLIDNFKYKEKTLISESGSSLSGGQIQRIGIARALYKNPEVIVFDESTSNLDNKTEEKILKTINNFCATITVIIVSHDPKPLNVCNKVFKIKNKQFILTKS